jgi:hypothetical protein
MEHHITFRNVDQLNLEAIVSIVVEVEGLDLYETEDEDGKNGGGWITQYFRTTSEISEEEQEKLDALEGAIESAYLSLIHI